MKGCRNVYLEPDQERNEEVKATCFHSIRDHLAGENVQCLHLSNRVEFLAWISVHAFSNFSMAS